MRGNQSDRLAKRKHRQLPRETTELKLKVQEAAERNRKLEAENEALQQQLLSEHVAHAPCGDRSPSSRGADVRTREHRKVG